MDESNVPSLHHTPASGLVVLRAAVALLGAVSAHADVISFDSSRDWDTWTIPPGVVQVAPNGDMSLVRIEKNINAVANARDFLHLVKSTKDLIPGGIRVVGSGAESADNVMDGSVDTWWQPSQDESVSKWWIEVDLGRMVLAEKIRLIFPDTPEATPFRNFSVFINDGVRATAAKDVFRFIRVGLTAEPNDERIVEYDLQTIHATGGTGEFLTKRDTLDFARVQYVRFVAEEQQLGAALAEVEVMAVGDNVILGSVERGGGVRGGTDLSNLNTLIDANRNTVWTISSTGDWVTQGHWFELDTGVTYWVDRGYFDVRQDRGGFSFKLATSSGERSAGLTADRIRSGLDFEDLTDIQNGNSPIRRMFDIRFPRRKARYYFWHQSASVDRQIGVSTEIMMFGEGHVAEVEMESDFIDLGGASSIRRLTWDADLPPGTFVEIRSQSGDTFFIERKYFSKNGIEVSEAQWNKLPSSQRLDVVEIQRPGSDWSGWSQAYAFPGEVFLSPSPRRFLQLQVKLGNDDPDVTPVLKDISLHFDDALISGGVTSRIIPRQAGFDSLQVFTYVLKPTFGSGDLGFDRVRIRVPFPVQEVAVRVAGEVAAPLSVMMVGDSLQVDLRERIQRDSVEVEFQTRIQANATMFDGWVSVAGDDLLQGVRPEDQHASTVFVPSVASGGNLIRDVEISPLLTPNGDGINDEAAIRFVLAKVEAVEAQVSIHNLSGRQVRVLTAGLSGHDWDGSGDDGKLLPPGAYICRIALAADVGEQTAQRIINLAY